MDLGLADKAYLLTGGSRGLGYTAAQALVAEGAKVVVAARDEQAVSSAARELGCTGVVADLADPAAAASLVESCVTTYGRVDGALVSVGGPPAGGSLDLTDEQW